MLRQTVAPARAIQLKEILDRIELPSFEVIPDRDAMSRASSKRWRLPGTEIDIALIETGPRAGEYLVSAGTVDRLPEFYDRVEKLPYKPGPAAELSDVYRRVSAGGAADYLQGLFELASRIGADRADPLDAQIAGLGKGPHRRRRNMAVDRHHYGARHLPGVCLRGLSALPPPRRPQRPTTPAPVGLLS